MERLWSDPIQLLSKCNSRYPILERTSSNLKAFLLKSFLYFTRACKRLESIVIPGVILVEYIQSHSPS
ncbi:uncharacterized protein BDR25DRAFT_131189 [Lindgomyces ingoldianus]|uniref:Uncharacterized protein n=1 Tax=Lindgomyces ingoldianus TaxID=673940 RepID=A0ACB6R259_9PLEO|nr:uncharacterized protein BDR25DRAFT_131189 [Lindgomyces ingoldianus]KAF2473339.1 hypothetical protein BDR25DRAFT_131189 [Lindgomyces ingoldianus]